ncbi:MAG: GTP-binding protein, partial [Betaproteobacteria bacterium]|nr:GTP-binding protein [Betaproteobacteria bacterium]
RTGALLRRAEQFLSQCELGARLARGISAVIVGAPNAGKSSLFNRLCGEDAAIVSAEAGTTRDLIFRDVGIGGVSVRLADTAGLRPRAGEIEKEGIARALRTAENADIVLLIRDHEGGAPEIKTDAAVVVVQNKTDARKIPAGRRNGAVYISAKTGEGMDGLHAAIAEIAGGATSEAPFTARARHVAALQETARCIAEANNCGAHAEIAAAWLASAQNAVASLTGAVDDEKLLGEIFSRFCIGK